MTFFIMPSNPVKERPAGRVSKHALRVVRRRFPSLRLRGSLVQPAVTAACRAMAQTTPAGSRAVAAVTTSAGLPVLPFGSGRPGPRRFFGCSGCFCSQRSAIGHPSPFPMPQRRGPDRAVVEVVLISQ